jgi:hypothetical protein
VEKATTADEGNAAVVVLRILIGFKSFKDFLWQIRLENQPVRWPIIPVYRRNHPRLQEESSPFTGGIIPVYRRA